MGSARQLMGLVGKGPHLGLMKPVAPSFKRKAPGQWGRQGANFPSSATKGLGADPQISIIYSELTRYKKSLGGNQGSKLIFDVVRTVSIIQHNYANIR